MDLIDECADIVFGLAVLEHILDLENFAIVCRRIIKSGSLAWLQGNPLWTSALGHHTWIDNKNGNSYFFHKNSPWEHWEHLCIRDNRDGAMILRQKGIPENDIHEILHQLLEHRKISRKTPSEIESAFNRIFDRQCQVFRKFSNWKKNKYYNRLKSIYGEDDLQCDEMQIVFGNMVNSWGVVP